MSSVVVPILDLLFWSSFQCSTDLWICFLVWSRFSHLRIYSVFWMYSRDNPTSHWSIPEWYNSGFRMPISLAAGLFHGMLITGLSVWICNRDCQCEISCPCSPAAAETPSTVFSHLQKILTNAYWCADGDLLNGFPTGHGADPWLGATLTGWSPKSIAAHIKRVFCAAGERMWRQICLDWEKPRLIGLGWNLVLMKFCESIGKDKTIPLTHPTFLSQKHKQIRDFRHFPCSVGIDSPTPAGIGRGQNHSGLSKIPDPYGLIRTGRARATQANWTCWCEWECPHCTQRIWVQIWARASSVDWA